MGLNLKNKKTNCFTVFSDGSIVFSKHVLLKNKVDYYNFLNKDFINSPYWMDKISNNATNMGNYKELNNYRNKFFNFK